MEIQQVFRIILPYKQIRVPLMILNYQLNLFITYIFSSENIQLILCEERLYIPLSLYRLHNNPKFAKS